MFVAVCIDMCAICIAKLYQASIEYQAICNGVKASQPYSENLRCSYIHTSLRNAKSDRRL